MLNRQARVTMTSQEGADYVGISYWLILQLVKRKAVPCIRAGGRILFRKEALDQWMDEQETANMTAETDYRKLKALPGK